MSAPSKSYQDFSVQKDGTKTVCYNLLSNADGYKFAIDVCYCLTFSEMTLLRSSPVRPECPLYITSLNTLCTVTLHNVHIAIVLRISFSLLVVSFEIM